MATTDDIPTYRLKFSEICDLSPSELEAHLNDVIEVADFCETVDTYVEAFRPVLAAHEAAGYPDYPSSDEAFNAALEAFRPAWADLMMATVLLSRGVTDVCADILGDACAALAKEFDLTISAPAVGISAEGGTTTFGLGQAVPNRAARRRAARG